MTGATNAKFKRAANATARKERAVQRTIDRKDKSKPAKKAEADAGRRARYPGRPFPSSIWKSRAARPTSSRRRCTTRRFTRARTSCKTRSR